MKHGLYASTISPGEVEDLALLTTKDVAQEMILMCMILLRLSYYLHEEELTLEEMVRIVPPAVTLARTIAQLQRQMEDVGIDWDTVLDALNEEWEIEV